MSRSETVLNKVFVQPQSTQTKLKTTLLPWTKRKGSYAPSMNFSLAAPSDLDVVHDSLFDTGFANTNAPYDAKQIGRSGDSNRWDHYLDLYSTPEDSDSDTIASSPYEIPDGSEYEPEEFMEDADFQLPVKKHSKLRRFLRPASYSRITPILDDAGDAPPETQLVVPPKQAFRPRKRTFRPTRVPVPQALGPTEANAAPAAVSDEDSIIVQYLRDFSWLSAVIQPFEKLTQMFPDYKLLIICLELLIAMWVLYQVSIIIETVALAVRALCIPLIIIGRVFGYL